MRKRILISSVIILAVCLTLLIVSKHTNKASTSEQSEPFTNLSPTIVQHPIQGDFQHLSAQQPGKSTNIVFVETSPGKSNAINSWLLSEWQAPINFYGKVIDQNSNPVFQAHIDFHWVEFPSSEGNRAKSTISDASGLFSLEGERGLNLSVSLSKSDYYTSREDNDSFTYGSLGGGGKFTPDPMNPVVFHLLEKGQGANLITSENGIRQNLAVNVPRDNSPVWVDFFQKKISSAGQLEINQIKPQWQSATNWSFSLSIPDGGLIENQDEFQFEAPESGYQPTVEYDFVKGETNWTTQTTRQFYITFGQPRKYGWLRIESNLAQETIFLTYAINPDGSQNLEPK